MHQPIDEYLQGLCTRTHAEKRSSDIGEDVVVLVSRRCADIDGSVVSYACRCAKGYIKSSIKR